MYREYILKLTEKFVWNEGISNMTQEVPPQQDVYKKTYFLKEEKIRVVYHLAPGRIIAAMRDFRKPVGDQKGSSGEIAQIFQVDPFAKMPKKQHLYAQLGDLLRTESQCLQTTRNSDREMNEILQLRGVEEHDVGLAISVYDTIRNDTV